MRLGQIARKLDITTQELAGYLEREFGHGGLGTNSRLTEEQLAQALRHFAPQQADRFFTSSKNLQAGPGAEDFTDPLTDPPVSENVPAAGPALPPPAEELPPPGSVEVIRPPKVELSGLKVLGKIELPEKKKKDAAPGGVPPEDGARPAGTPRTVKHPTTDSSHPRKNPVALQREREERELLRKRQEEARRKKEKKTSHYHKNIEQKKVQVGRAPRVVSEELEVMPPLHEPPAPRTWWGKLMRWFNT